MSDTNIYARIAAVEAKLDVIKKNKSGYGYTYADEEAILPKVKKFMRENKLVLIPQITPGLTKVQPIEIVKTKVGKNGNTYEDKSMETMVYGDMTWTFVCTDDPDQQLPLSWTFVGSAADASQAFGGSLTYSQRYFLTKFFHIPTTDNPEEYRTKQKKQEEEETAAIIKDILDSIHAKIIARMTELEGDEHEAEAKKFRESVSALAKKYTKESTGTATLSYFKISTTKAAMEFSSEIEKLIQSTEKE